MVRLFPKGDFSQFMVVPSVPDNAMLGRSFPGKVVGLCGAGDGRESRVDDGRLAKRQEFGDGRSVRSDVSPAQSDDIENSGAIHVETGLR